jgi:hypothetical protein
MSSPESLKQKTDSLVKQAEFIKDTLGKLQAATTPTGKARNLPNSIFSGAIDFPPIAPKQQIKQDEVENEGNESMLYEENKRLEGSLKVMRGMESKLIARIEALESRKTPEHDPPSNTKVDTNAAFLKHKNSVQESEILSLKLKLESTCGDKQIALAHRELQKRYSRQSLELKSVLEQNEILRRENRRLVEGEVELRRNLMEQPRPLSPVLQSPVVISAADPPESQFDETLRKTLLKLVDEEVFKATDAKSQGSNIPSEARVGFPSTYHFEIVLTTLNSLRPLLQAPLSSSLMTSVQTLVHSALGCSTAVLSMGEESRIIETRIAHIGQESVYVRQETEKTLSDMYYYYEGELEKMRAERKEVDESFAALSAQVHKGVEKNASSPVSEQLLEKGANSPISVVDKLQLDPLPIPVVETSQYVHASPILKGDVLHDLYEKIEELSGVNYGLKETCESYKVSLADYKREVSLLRAGGINDTMNNSPRIMEIRDALEVAETELEDEKLRNQKAVELIKVLKDQLGNCRVEIAQNQCGEDQPRDAGKTFNQFERIINQESLGAGEPGIGEVEVLMGLVRENDHSSEKFKELHEMIEGIKSLTLTPLDQADKRKGLEKKVKILSRECTTLKESLERATTNESMIMDKYKTSQREIKSSRDLYNECTRVLEAYEKMWKDCAIVSFSSGIQATIDEAAPLVAFDTAGE